MKFYPKCIIEKKIRKLFCRNGMSTNGHLVLAESVVVGVAKVLG
jgi:hypothetical protein